AEVYPPPHESGRPTTTLENGEIILELEYEQPLSSTYLKAMDRQAWSFALVGVAAARFESGPRIALAGVAPIPRAPDGHAGLEQATPLPQTAFKVEIATALVRRALEAVA